MSDDNCCTSIDLDGNEGNDTPTSGYDSDSLHGGNGNDTLNGTEAWDNYGVGTIDTLTGGLNADQFILGISQVTFYNDGNTATVGLNDYVLITGFNSAEDTIQLRLIKFVRTEFIGQ